MWAGHNGMEGPTRALPAGECANAPGGEASLCSAGGEMAYGHEGEGLTARGELRPPKDPRENRGAPRTPLASFR